jgi:hypothetical protein
MAAATAALRAAGKGLPLERSWEAQELAFDALDTPNPRRRVELATKALARHPWCGDAYAILADEAPPQSAAETHLRRLAVAAAEFALKAELGPDALEAERVVPRAGHSLPFSPTAIHPGLRPRRQWPLAEGAHVRELSHRRRHAGGAAALHEAAGAAGAVIGPGRPLRHLGEYRGRR